MFTLGVYHRVLAPGTAKNKTKPNQIINSISFCGVERCLHSVLIWFSVICIISIIYLDGYGIRLFRHQPNPTLRRNENMPVGDMKTCHFMPGERSYPEKNSSWT